MKNKWPPATQDVSQQRTETDSSMGRDCIGISAVTLAYMKDGSETGVCLVAHSPIHGLHSVGGWFTVRWLTV